MEFEPPKKLPPPPKWATYIPIRTPNFKIHTGLGPAKNAIIGAQCGILYEWDGEQWVNRFKVTDITFYMPYSHSNYWNVKNSQREMIREKLKGVK